MTAINKIPRGMRALIIIVILVLLIWFIVPRDFFIPSVLIAIAVLALFIFLIFKSPAKNKNSLKNNKEKPLDKSEVEDKVLSSNTLEDNSNDEYNDSIQKINQRGKVPESNKNKPKASDEAARYYRLAAQSKLKEEYSGSFSQPKESVTEKDSNEKPVLSSLDSTEISHQAIDTSKILEKTEISDTAMPIINEDSSLTLEEKNQLVNAVWYRCENPYCKYTHFLDVHHIIDEKDGGSNKLSNLIVLCPYCHDLAHRKEIPVSEMITWVGNREERFKFYLEWRYQ